MALRDGHSAEWLAGEQECFEQFSLGGGPPCEQVFYPRLSACAGARMSTAPPGYPPVARGLALRGDARPSSPRVATTSWPSWTVDSQATPACREPPRGNVTSPSAPAKGLTLSALKSHLWDCAEILRGSAVDRTDWKGYILPLLFFKRICDVWDEETAEAARAVRRRRPGRLPRGPPLRRPRGLPLARRPRDARRTSARRSLAPCGRSSGPTPTPSTASSAPPTGATGRCSPTRS